VPSSSIALGIPNAESFQTPEITTRVTMDTKVRGLLFVSSGTFVVISGV